MKLAWARCGESTLRRVAAWMRPTSGCRTGFCIAGGPPWQRRGGRRGRLM